MPLNCNYHPADKLGTTYAQGCANINFHHGIETSHAPLHAVKEQTASTGGTVPCLAAVQHSIRYTLITLRYTGSFQLLNFAAVHRPVCQFDHTSQTRQKGRCAGRALSPAFCLCTDSSCTSLCPGPGSSDSRRPPRSRCPRSCRTSGTLSPAVARHITSGSHIEPPHGHCCVSAACHRRKSRVSQSLGDKAQHGLRMCQGGDTTGSERLLSKNLQQ